jgi:putative transcriptional regulator
MTANPLRNKIKVYRAMNDWTQEELARRVDVTRKTINTVENRKFVPSAYLALKIARAFGVSVEEIFQIDDGLSDSDNAAT